MFERIFLGCFLLVIIPCIEGATRLNEYISHYEPLDYDTNQVRESHNRVKRWINEHGNLLADDYHEREVHLNFMAHGRDFKLRLKRDAEIFSSNLQIYGDDINARNNNIETDIPHIYTGTLEDDPESVVFGYLKEGVFDGKIITEDGTFYVERSNKYPLTSGNTSRHSMIYSGYDIHDPYHQSHTNGCGISDEVNKWMNQIQNSAVENETKLHQNINSKNVFGNSNRVRRTTRSSNPQKTCTLSIQTDPLLWHHIVQQEGMTNDENDVRKEMLSLIAQHVKALNYIYSRTLFSGKDTYLIRFQVQHIKIDTDKSCRPGYRGNDKNPLCDPNIDASNLLNLHSLQNHNNFCLAYLFTYRDFSGGTLGLAWPAAASGASGGVCEKYKTYTEIDNRTYQSTRRSLNTGIITFANFNRRVPPQVSQLAFAHQIGHNLGSPHDYPLHCRPGGPDGNFLMFASATSGDRPNNSKFSDCSIRNISSVLDAIIHDGEKTNCFIDANGGSFCGNNIVEEGEECDCGFTYAECEESCCYPREVTALDRERNPEATGCKRREQVTCSPSEGPCCDHTCNYKDKAQNTFCRCESECSFRSTCDGSGASCPVPQPKSDLTPCNGGTQVCQRGECMLSICVKYGLEKCFLSSTDENMDDERLCELACFDDTRKCRPVSELKLHGLPEAGLRLRRGAPCDNFRGYCDAFNKCRTVDEDGTLSALMNQLWGLRDNTTLHQVE